MEERQVEISSIRALETVFEIVLLVGFYLVLCYLTLLIEY